MEATIRCYHPGDRDAVVRLWADCGLVVPWNDPYADLERKVQAQPDLLLVAVSEGRLVGSVMAGYEGHRGWINYLAVAPGCRRQGLGRRLMDAAEARLRALGCPKINLQVRASNTGVIEFYTRLGFAVDGVTSLGKRLIPDLGWEGR